MSTPRDVAMTVNTDGLSAQQIAQAVTDRKLSALDATEVTLARIAKHDPVLNSFTDITAERARAKARAVDAAIAAGQKVGPLAGVPFAVKNLFDVKGLSTRAGSKINRDLAPSSRDATLIERMEAAGAVLVGALNMGEYAYDFTGENVHEGPSRNPHDPTRMTGGSSGGSGSAVGGALVPVNCDMNVAISKSCVKDNASISTRPCNSEACWFPLNVRSELNTARIPSGYRSRTDFADTATFI